MFRIALVFGTFAAFALWIEPAAAQCGRQQQVVQQQPAQVTQLPAANPVEARQEVRRLSSAPASSSSSLAQDCPNCQNATGSKLAQFGVPPARYASQSAGGFSDRVALDSGASCSSCQKKAALAPPPEPQPASAVQTVNTQSKVRTSTPVRSTSFHPLEKLRDAVSGKGTIRQTQVIKPDGTVIQRETTR